MPKSPNSIWETPTAKQLAIVMSQLTNLAQTQNFLRDVMTEKEIIEISSRLEAARLLNQGTKYTDIVEQTKLSSRTIARISDWMKNGRGGYQQAIKIADSHHAHSSPVRAE